MKSVYIQNREKGGFSLIELMVSLTIFSIVMTVSIGTLLVLIDANTKAQALSTAMTNISFALDSISRNLRTGTRFHCATASSMSATQDDRLITNFSSTSISDSSNCTGAGSNDRGIVFTPGTDTKVRVGYRLSGSQIEQWVDKKNTADGWVPITSNQAPTAVEITALEFTLDGAANTDTEQPRITILVQGEVDDGDGEPTTFQIQSNVTQRVLNY